MPEAGEFARRQAVGCVNEVAQTFFEQKCFAPLSAGGFDRSRGFVSQALEPGGRERVILAANSFHFGDECVGIQFGGGLELQAGLFDAVLDAKPVEEGSAHCALRIRNVDQPTAI